MPTAQRNLSHSGILLVLTGLLFSRFCLSVGMLLLLAATLTGRPVRQTLAKFFRQRDLLLLTSLFFLYLLTGLYSDDLGYFMERMRVVLPLLFLPFAFAQKQAGSREELDNWLYFFFLLMVATAFHSVIVTVYRQSVIQVSGHLTTPVNHVRYSLMVAFSIFTGWHLYLRRRFRFRFERKMVLGCTVFLIVCLHFLAVRSGLVGFYLGLLFGFWRWVSLPGRGKFHGPLFAGLLLLLALCFQLPGFQRELKATAHSLAAGFRGESSADASDRGRLLSIKKGIELGLEHFWTGAGLGDIKSEMAKKYDAGQQIPPEDGVLLPHNQFVFCFTFSGFIGLVWFGLVWLSLP